MTGGGPAVSVIVPAHRCAVTLRKALEALRRSDLPGSQWELVVVDDASGDDTPAVATAYADRVVVLVGTHRGPAYARNRGAEVARGNVLAFVDADVCVHGDALRRMLALLTEHPDVGAVFGAYDTAPSAHGLVSRYANLVHHYVHVHGAGDAETFWAGCGAVRRHVFESVGGYDERRYTRPQIEDIELGHRIRDAGRRILLRPEIQCTHLKRWTLRSMIVASVRDRGVPWVELLLEDGTNARASALNVNTAEQRYTMLVGIAAIGVVISVIAGNVWWLLPSAALLAGALAGSVALLRWLWHQGGARLALAGVALRVLYYGLNGVSVAYGTARYFYNRGGTPRKARARSALRALQNEPPQVGC